MSANTKSDWRIGKREGSSQWLIKHGAGSWRVIHRTDTLKEAAEYLARFEVDISQVAVVSRLPGFETGDWPSLAEAIANG